MNRRRHLLLAATLLAATATAFGAKENKVRNRNAAAAVTPAPRNDSSLVPNASVDTFRLITDRNIFSTIRTGRSSRSGSDEPVAPQGDSIALVGTLESEKGLFAFFDSNDPKYRKAVHEGDVLAPFAVKRITSDTVELVRDGKPLTIHVAQQLRRSDGRDWALSAYEVAPSATTTSSTDSTAAATPPPIPADASEALRRLMEKRQQQLKQ